MSTGWIARNKKERFDFSLSSKGEKTHTHCKVIGWPNTMTSFFFTMLYAKVNHLSFPIACGTHISKLAINFLLARTISSDAFWKVCEKVVNVQIHEWLLYLDKMDPCWKGKHRFFVQLGKRVNFASRYIIHTTCAIFFWFPQRNAWASISFCHPALLNIASWWKFLTKVFDVYTSGGIQVFTSKPYKVILGDWTTLIINIF